MPAISQSLLHARLQLLSQLGGLVAGLRTKRQHPQAVVLTGWSLPLRRQQLLLLPAHVLVSTLVAEQAIEPSSHFRMGPVFAVRQKIGGGLPVSEPNLPLG